MPTTSKAMFCERCRGYVPSYKCAYCDMLICGDCLRDHERNCAENSDATTPGLVRGSEPCDESQ